MIVTNPANPANPDSDNIGLQLTFSNYEKKLTPPTTTNQPPWISKLPGRAFLLTIAVPRSYLLRVSFECSSVGSEEEAKQVRRKHEEEPKKTKGNT
jgi:hypothetical protein